MAKWGAALLGGGVAAAAAVAALWYAGPPSASAPPPEPFRVVDTRPSSDVASPPASQTSAAPITAAPTPAAAAPVAASPAADAAPGGEAAIPAPAAPRFDVVRIEPDGSALFAGVAAPDARVEVLLDGRVVAQAQAARDGGFVAFGSTAPAPDAAPGALARIDLSARAPDGVVAEAAAPLFVAPTDARAAEPAPPLVFRAGSQGATVVQAPSAPPKGGVTLDSVNYGEDGVVEVGGRAEGLRRLRVWANALLIAETVAEPDGRWTARASRGLAPGGYTLRVEALDASGSVLAQTASPFRREAAAAPPATGQLVVQPGDSLWRLAQNAYGAGARYTVIYDANAQRIRDPDLIYPGQVFTLPTPAPAR